MKKFIVTEEEKNRILNLHNKLISEQMTQIGNTRVGAASKIGATQLPTIPTVLRPNNQDPTQRFAVKEKEGEVSASFFEQNKIGDYSEDPASAETPDSTGGKTGFQWKDTNLTVDELKSGKTVSMGMRGPIVKQIQELLIGKGYKKVSKSGEPDSMFGRLTKGQVEKFQSENKDDKGEQLRKDGIVGPKTINALLAPKPTPNTKGLERAVKSYLPTGVSANLPTGVSANLPTGV